MYLIRLDELSLYINWSFWWLVVTCWFCWTTTALFMATVPNRADRFHCVVIFMAASYLNTMQQGWLSVSHCVDGDVMSWPLLQHSTLYCGRSSCSAARVAALMTATWLWWWCMITNILTIVFKYKIKGLFWKIKIQWCILLMHNSIYTGPVS